jgi:hypothetical protein
MKQMPDMTARNGGKIINNRKIRLSFKFDGADKVFADSRLHPF